MANGYFDHLSDSIAVLKITVQLLLDFLQLPSRIVHYADIFSRNNRPTLFSLPRRFLPFICFCYTTISRLFSARLYPLSNFFSLPIFFDSTNFLSISIILFHSNLTPISIVVFSSFCWLFPNYYIFLFYRSVCFLCAITLLYLFFSFFTELPLSIPSSILFSIFAQSFISIFLFFDCIIFLFLRYSASFRFLHRKSLYSRLFFGLFSSHHSLSFFHFLFLGLRFSSFILFVTPLYSSLSL